MRPTLTESEILKLALISVALGVIAGILFDVFKTMRIFRKREKNGRFFKILDHVLCFFEDILFFVVLAVLNVLMLSSYGKGALRLEAPVIALTVFLVWHSTVGKFTSGFANWIKALIIKVLGFILRPLKRKINKLYKKQKSKRLEIYSKKEREKLKRKFRA